MRLPNLETYHRTGSLEEARLLAANPGARILGGGTRLVASEDPGCRSLVDVGSLGLDTVATEGPELRFGATVRVERLAGLEEPLSLAARRTSFSRAKRNQATVAGEVLWGGESAFLTTLFLAAGARVEIAGGLRELEAFRAGLGGEIALGFVIRRPRAWGLEELAVVPTATPLVVVAAAIAPGGLSARLAASGGIPWPVVVEVPGTDPAEAASRIAEVYGPPDRPWASGPYAVEMARVLARRLMERIGR